MFLQFALAVISKVWGFVVEVQCCRSQQSVSQAFNRTLGPPQYLGRSPCHCPPLQKMIDNDNSSFPL